MNCPKKLNLENLCNLFSFSITYCNVTLKDSAVFIFLRFRRFSMTSIILVCGTTRVNFEKLKENMLTIIYPGLLKFFGYFGMKPTQNP